MKFSTLFLLLLALSAPAFAQTNPEYAIEPPASWTVPYVWAKNASSPPEGVENGSFYLLRDIQVNAIGTLEEYRHFAVKIINQAGIDNSSSISIAFDPSYQKLAIHRITIHRGDTEINRLDAKNIKVLYRETDMEYRVYDGTKMVNIILDDVRVGDVLEYSYTLRGNNPLLQNKFFIFFEAGWDQPLGDAYTRLLWEKGRPLQIKNFQTQLTPKISEKNKFSEYLWEQHEIPATKIDSNIPDWYEPYPTIQVSEMQNWHDVVKWGEMLFSKQTQISPELHDTITAIAKSHPTSEEKLLAALRFVQNDIRYLSIAIGNGTYTPTDASLTFQRRYGDCKDKVHLLHTILGELGITAYPALVNTVKRQAVGDYLPSPAVFDHVILKTVIGEKIYWLDPTVSHQNGSLDRSSQSDYGAALVLTDTTQALEKIPPVLLTEPQFKLHETFEVDPDPNKPVLLEREVIYIGNLADEKRSSTEWSNKSSMQIAALRGLSNRYPFIKAVKEMEISDDLASNTLTLRQHFEIPKAWKWLDKMERWEFSYEVSTVDNYVYRPGSVYRTMPYALYHPVYVQETIDVHFTDPRFAGWNLEESGVKTITHPDFEMKLDTQHTEGSLTRSLTYRSFSDHVRPEDMASYNEAMEEAVGYTGYSIRIPDIMHAKSSNVRQMWIGFSDTLVDILINIVVFIFCWLLYSKLLELILAAPRGNETIMIRLAPTQYTRLFPYPQQAVWEVLSDPTTITWIPKGAAGYSLERFTRSDEASPWDGNRYFVTYRVKRVRFGIQTFEKEIEILECIPPQSISMRFPPHERTKTADSKKRKTLITGTLCYALTSQGTGTLLTVSHERQLLMTYSRKPRKWREVFIKKMMGFSFRFNDKINSKPWLKYIEEEVKKRNSQIK